MTQVLSHNEHTEFLVVLADFFESKGLTVEGKVYDTIEEHAIMLEESLEELDGLA